MQHRLSKYTFPKFFSAQDYPNTLSPSLEQSDMKSEMTHQIDGRKRHHFQILYPVSSFLSLIQMVRFLFSQKKKLDFYFKTAKFNQKIKVKFH